jgi:hypothetical protein
VTVTIPLRLIGLTNAIREDAAVFGHDSAGDVRAQKRDQYAQLLREQAMLPRPYAQIAADEVGGFVTKFAQSGALARSGLGGLENGLRKPIEGPGIGTKRRARRGAVGRRRAIC